MPQNVILIVLDTARADAFEPYGAAPGSSPAIADLARRGHAVPDAYAAACWTVPSHAAMFTGLLPRENGLVRAPGGLPHGCKPVLEAQRDRVLAEVFRRNGYATAGVSTNLWLTPESGFATGFDRFVTLDTERQAQMAFGNRRTQLRWILEGARANVDDGAAAAEGVLKGWIDEAPSMPFFWFVNLVECHSPYLPPRPYNDLGLLDRARAANEARHYLTLSSIWRTCAGGSAPPDEALERMRHLYARAIKALDDWIARVAEMLDDADLLDETLLIVVSDHGENFGENGLMGHAFSLDDRLLHVPLVFCGPDLPRDREAPFSLVSLPATIASTVGLPAHPWGEPASGPAVAHFDPPAPRDDPRVDRAIAGWGLEEDAAGKIATPLTCATDGRFKLVARGDHREILDFYDLGMDPGETAPVPTESVPAGIRAELQDAVAPAGRVEPDLDESESGSKPDAQELEQLEERMRLLGYL